MDNYLYIKIEDNDYKLKVFVKKVYILRNWKVKRIYIERTDDLIKIYICHYNPNLRTSALYVKYSNYLVYNFNKNDIELYTTEEFQKQFQI